MKKKTFGNEGFKYSMKNTITVTVRRTGTKETKWK